MIDDHAHPFPLAFTPLDLSGFSLDVEGGPNGDQRRLALQPARLAVEMLRIRVARRLGVEPADAVSARDDGARADWSGYVRALFADADITGMVLDAGWQGLAPGDAARYAEVAGVPVWELARLEPVVDRLLEEGADAAEVVDAVDTYMGKAVADGAVGFKTVLAYRTGLAVDPDATLEKAERGLAADRTAGVALRRSGKALRDLLFHRVLERCADAGLPLQVHTGMGDSEIRLAESDPLLLDEVLRTPAGSSVDVVLIHASYPWHEQAGYLASVRPRVWTEYSLCNLFSPATTADRLLRLLDVAPTARITLGSDGHGLPESHWFGCVVLRDAWRTVRERLAGSVSAAWLDETGERIFERNARELYHLRVVGG
ncbi:MAG: amidohydrolase [Candidatus Dormibacteraeota bacterium]|uniref:Amidohydrolase n=1 Tax=Candidatus Amunia macphersoniae TaxID=3127014 RepID=A0A934NFW6_9BACT|nr:amidohydrolase [Candidatus Dormibacteraeota bacterium]